MEPTRHIENIIPGDSKSRPVVLSILCLFGFVYFTLLSLLFILAIFYSGWITEVTNKYMPAEAVTRSRVLLVFITGALLHAVAFAGLILIWNRRKMGYFLLGIPCFAIAAWHLFQSQISISSTLVYIIFIIVFGLYYRRLR